jgi:hypothetical protein
MIEPRRQALEAMRHGFRTVPAISENLLQFDCEELSKLVVGQETLSVDIVLGLLSADGDEYEQLIRERNVETGGFYSVDSAVHKNLCSAIEKLDEYELVLFLRFVTGSVPAIREHYSYQ